MSARIGFVALLGLTLPVSMLAVAAGSSSVDPSGQTLTTNGDPPAQTSSPVTPPTSEALVRNVLEQQIRLAEQIERNQEQVKQQVAKLRPNPLDKWLPAIFGLLGTVAASVGAFLLQRQRLLFDHQAARQAAGIKEVSEIKGFRSRQLNEFYAPMEALLRQGLPSMRVFPLGNI